MFITATGTEIGKTFVVSGLIRHCALAAIKPVVSGFDPTDFTASDPAILLRAMGRPINLEEIGEISPWRFRAPVSPDIAASREATSIDTEKVIAFCRSRFPCLVEGVGGVMVPLNERHTVLDWMSALRLPVILVAGTYLGTISHILTAHDCIKRRGLEMAALVLNRSSSSSAPPGELIPTLRNFLPDSRIVGLERDQQDFGPLAQALNFAAR
jgi:dethiobiotin synthetase